MKKVMALFCLLSASPMALADEYCNVRFEYCVDVPSQLQWMPEADNGDGRQFKLANSYADIAIFGSYSPIVLGYKDIEYLNKKQNEKKTDAVVTYELRKGNSYTFSGYNKYGDIYYHVVKVKDGTVAELHFVYPKNDKEKMNKIVNQMAKSFKLY